MINSTKHPVIRGVRYFLAHTPGLVRHGSKPARDLMANPGLLPALTSHLRSFQEAVAYPPHRVFLGAIYPDDLALLPKPWYEATGQEPRWSPHGEIMPEDEFYALLKIADDFDLLWLEEAFSKETAASLAQNFPRQALHAGVLGFVHPVRKEPMRFESPWPEDLAALASALRAIDGAA